MQNFLNTETAKVGGIKVWGKMDSTINEINIVTDLINKFGKEMTLEELYCKLFQEHCEYFSD